MLKTKYFHSPAYHQSFLYLVANILNSTRASLTSLLNPLAPSFLPTNIGDLSLLLTLSVQEIDNNYSNDPTTNRKKLKEIQKPSSNKSKNQNQSQRLTDFHFTSQRIHSPFD